MPTEEEQYASLSYTRAKILSLRGGGHRVLAADRQNNPEAFRSKYVVAGFSPRSSSSCFALPGSRFAFFMFRPAGLTLRVLHVSPCRAHASRKRERGLKPRDYILDLCIFSRAKTVTEVRYSLLAFRSAVHVKLADIPCPKN